MSDRSWIRTLFVLTLGISSAALFVLQPMCARIVLPHLGGSPSVWTTCMLFFQAGLVGGYLYAHASRRLGLRARALLHAGLLLAACAFLPPFAGRSFEIESGASPSLWLLVTLIGSIGLPYLVLASSAPLLQVWLARTPTGADPYFLYAASNAGSLLGLLAYPFLIERFLTLGQQAYAWSIGFVLFAVLSAICAVATWRAPARGATASSPGESRAAKKAGKTSKSVSRAVIARWLFLAFLPSSLLLSVTVHLTADLAPIPFLWVAPLGLYLLTYIFAFSPRASAGGRFWSRWLPLVVLILAVVLLTEATAPLLLIIFLHLAGLFWIGMLCHGELARQRPPVAYLTLFYLCIAVGGALGGIFNALIAPLVFDTLAEYPLGLVLACLVPAVASSDRAKSSRRAKIHDVALPALLVAFTAILAFAAPRFGVPHGQFAVALVFGIPLVLCYTFSSRPVRFALGIAGIMLASSAYPGAHGEPDARLRSFFGVHRVTNDGSYRMLVHGNTEHGRQSLDPARRAEPLSYYFPTGPMGDLFGALHRSNARIQNVAVVGLGAGALAAYAQPKQNWTFFEIDPSVVFIARQSGYFTYLRDAVQRGAAIRVVQGDGRFQLSRSKDQFDLIILDAFGSDSIPAHLFTREAFQVYRERLTDHGLIAIHYSSRYFDLRPVLGALAHSPEPPWFPISRDDLRLTIKDSSAGKAPSRWAVFARSSDHPAASVLLAAQWEVIQPESSAAPWTDDHADILRALQITHN